MAVHIYYTDRVLRQEIDYFSQVDIKVPMKFYVLCLGQLVDCARAERAHKRKEINNNTNYNIANTITIITTYNTTTFVCVQLRIATFGRRKKFRPPGKIPSSYPR